MQFVVLAQSSCGQPSQVYGPFPTEASALAHAKAQNSFFAGTHWSWSAVPLNPPVGA